jgi:hypothetical protein
LLKNDQAMTHGAPGKTLPKFPYRKVSL